MPPFVSGGIIVIAVLILPMGLVTFVKGAWRERGIRAARRRQGVPAVNVMKAIMAVSDSLLVMHEDKELAHGNP
jgi:hypothetical protein